MNAQYEPELQTKSVGLPAAGSTSGGTNEARRMEAVREAHESP